MAAFLDEITEHIPSLRRYARALTRNGASADDLVQDCLERAIRKRGLWKPTGDMKGWLFRILLNIYRNDLRRNRGRIYASLDWSNVDPAQDAPQTSRIAFLEMMRCIDNLPDDQREALLLVVLEGSDYAAAAEVLDIPAGTLMSRLSRARSALRRMTDGPEEQKLRTVK